MSITTPHAPRSRFKHHTSKQIGTPAETVTLHLSNKEFEVASLLRTFDISQILHNITELIGD